MVDALRMRPDRIVIGECRGAEALDMLQAMNTGHEGSLTQPCTPIRRATVLPGWRRSISDRRLRIAVKAMRQQISSALDLIIQVESPSGGGRRVTERLPKYCGIEGEVILMQA